MRTNVSGRCAICCCRYSAALLLAAGVSAQRVNEPTVGQPGKDAVWVPTSAEMVEKMLDMAKVTPQDFVIDLGSGDGRMVIAAAKRGARALGVEYNDDLVELSRQRARDAGVADKATFVQGDMFEADISKATVLALFLLPENLERLRDKFLAIPTIRGHSRGPPASARRCRLAGAPGRGGIRKCQEVLRRGDRRAVCGNLPGPGWA